MVNTSPLVQGSQSFVSSRSPALSGEFSNNRQRISIIGDGVESLAVANLISDETIDVCPIDSPEAGFYYGVHSFEIRQRNASVCFYRGSISAEIICDDISVAVRNSRAIFVCAGATRYSDIAAAVAPYLENGQVICLVNSPLGGALQFQSELRKLDSKAQVSLIEIGRIFDSILVESGVMLISGLRKRIPVCGITRNDTRKGLSIIQSLVDEPVPSSNVIERGLTDVERLLRPILALAALMGSKQNVELTVNDYVLNMVEAVETEVQSLAAVYGSTAPGFLKSVQDFMNVGDIASESPFETLELALVSLGDVVLGEADINNETFLSVLEEDVKEIYALLSDLGTHAHLPVPTIDSIVDLSAALLKKNVRDEGRSVSAMGLVGFDSREIMDLVNN